MPKRFNYTGRQKILREHCTIQLRREERNLFFDADLKLESYQLDPQAHIFVEAYRRSGALWKRIPFGSVSQPPNARSWKQDRALSRRYGPSKATRQLNSLPPAHCGCACWEPCIANAFKGTARAWCEQKWVT